MNLHIRLFSPDDMEDVVQLSLLAWTPVYHSFEQVLGTTIYSLLFPDWKKTQRAIVEKICSEHEKTLVWVAEAHGMMTGFIAYTLNSQENGQDERYLEIRHVILSAAKDLARLPPRSFAALRMTCRTPHQAAHGKSSLQISRQGRGV